VSTEDLEKTEELQEQALRADCYLFLAGLLSAAPSQSQLLALQSMGDDSARGALAAAWRSLSAAAQTIDEPSVGEEFFDLFIGLGRGELVPFGSWYITGFLQEQPLADLRDTLQALSLTRVEASGNTEDHIAQQFAVMSMLIANPEEYSSDQQQAFFNQHLAPWSERFFADLQTAKSAVFYRSVGELGAAFCDFEKQYLSMSS